MNSMKIKERLYRFLEPSPPDETRWEKSFDGFILALILLSVGAVILRTMKSLPAMMEKLTEVLRPYWETPPTLARLTGYGWWLEGVSTMETQVSKLG